jgi:hypothetical protein
MQVQHTVPTQLLAKQVLYQLSYVPNVPLGSHAELLELYRLGSYPPAT